PSLHHRHRPLPRPAKLSPNRDTQTHRVSPCFLPTRTLPPSLLGRKAERHAMV
ncbi:hypothetical protein C8R44DRAFT_785661, partial [Mycena epipterygia]